MRIFFEFFSALFSCDKSSPGPFVAHHFTNLINFKDLPSFTPYFFTFLSRQILSAAQALFFIFFQNLTMPRRSKNFLASFCCAKNVLTDPPFRGVSR
ncbi:hypothetical protein BGLA2_2860004 [Burkholderia gladioli]|nr:hypothetical protein BGLA2_2860004 [Burkholderia gladioli]